MTTPHDWLAWQLADSAYPAGGFVHSSGIEAALRQALLQAVDELDSMLRDVMVAAAHGVMPFADEAHRQPEAFERVDRLCDATLLNPIAHRASTEQGRAMLSATSRVFERDGIARIDELCRSGKSPGHFAVVFGALCAYLGLTHEQVRRLMLFQLARSVVSASIRLGMVGPIEGQKLIARSGELAEQLAGEIKIDIAQVCQTAPMLDLAQANHDRGYTRLFRS